MAAASKQELDCGFRRDDEPGKVVRAMRMGKENGGRMAAVSEQELDPRLNSLRLW